jgi:hypothetical protein
MITKNMAKFTTTKLSSESSCAEKGWRFTNVKNIGMVSSSHHPHARALQNSFIASERSSEIFPCLLIYILLSASASSVATIASPSTYRSVTTLHPSPVGNETVVIESYVVDVPPGNTHADCRHLLIP